MVKGWEGVVKGWEGVVKGWGGCGEGAVSAMVFRREEGVKE